MLFDLDAADVNQIFTPPERLEDCLVVKYKLGLPEGANKDVTAAVLALNTSLGTVRRLPYEDKNRISSGCARVLNATLSGEHAIVEVAYPHDLAGIAEGLPLLLTTVWLSAEYSYTSDLSVVDIIFPHCVVDHFSGPRFGIAGLRKVLKVPNRAIFGIVIKPRLGVSLAAIAQQCHEGLLGGADFVVDDELIVNPPGEFCFEHRVKVLHEMAVAATRESGESKWFIPNVTSTNTKALGYIQSAAAIGVPAVMANAFTMGYGSFQELASSAPTMPIINNGIGTGILTRPQKNTGVSNLVMSKLSRLAGADGTNTGLIGSLWYTEDAIRGSIGALKGGLYEILPSMPVGSGGLNVANLWTNLHFLGQDVMFEAGSGILGYPGGPRAACRAFRNIIEHIDHSLPPEAADEQIVKIARKDGQMKMALDALGWHPRTA
jgi:ribulose-bisphosphate carboxylase large chain